MENPHIPHPSTHDIRRAIDRAHQERADALRHGFRAFARLFSRRADLAHAIPAE
ncbi:RSP_7527 family protein [Algicella marina]|uniref:Uncharacterized protein n=1 Tax=Algicella marina TaxID=2683284 RepID=A0A6P1T2T5_9RHOB|nr:hypothetical protein [Algicella marina]QHQ37028.1 hypothetical protein GO499_18490 [Algicella marina]